MAKAKKIPFRISARTARLIGRQNFPNAEGAIIDLLKNKTKIWIVADSLFWQFILAKGAI
jgi:hypothetical protein